jgi:predicted RNase H-like nuclease (RuvC/YqgF family)
MPPRKNGPESREATLQRLLRESEELSRRSEELAAEVKTLRRQVSGSERRKRAVGTAP